MDNTFWQKKSFDANHLLCKQDTDNEPVFLVSEFSSLKYLLIFQDKILVLDFSSRYQKKNPQMRFSETILRPEDKAQILDLAFICITYIE